MTEKVYIQANADVKAIRHEKYNGRDHIVVPSYTLPFNVVMNGGLYPRAEIEANYKKLEDTLAPVGHPQLDGEWISATHPAAIHTNHIGAFNRNVRIDEESGRVYLEKWIDVDYAANTEQGKRVLAKIEAVQNGSDTDPIHTSTGVILSKVMANNSNGAYKWTAKIHSFDHDAILLDQAGAAGPDKGVGMMVNSDDAIEYDIDDDETLTDDDKNWLKRIIDAAKAKIRQSKSTQTQENSEMTPQELDTLMARINESVGESIRQGLEKVKEEVGKNVKDLEGKVESVANQLGQVLQANQDAALAEKRAAVKDAYGMDDAAVKELSVNALDAMLAKSGKAPHLQNNSGGGSNNGVQGFDKWPE